MPKLEDVNKVRVAAGLPPLDKLVEKTTTSETDPKNETNIPEKPKEGETTPESKPTPESTPAPVVGEMTNEQLIELLGNRGIKISSLEDLKPKDPQKTPQELAEEEEAEKLAFGLTKGLFKKADYENFVTDNNSKVELVFSQFAAEAKAEDSTLTDEEIRQEFEEKYGLDAEVGTRKHKRGAKEIEVIAKEILKAKHAKIYEAENKFASHKETSTSQLAYNQNIIAKTPEYKKNVEEAFAEVKKISEGIEIPDESIVEMKNLFLESKFAENQIKAGFTKEQIVQQVKAAVYSKNLPFILQRNSELAIETHKAGAKGIVIAGNERKELPTKKNLTPEQQQVYDTYLANQPKPVAAQN